MVFRRQVKPKRTKRTKKTKKTKQTKRPRGEGPVRKHRIKGKEYNDGLYAWGKRELGLSEDPVFNAALAGKHMVSYFAK